jgi:hypothetical protein
MVGGTSFHRWIHAASLGQHAGKIFLRKNKNELPAVRTLEVFLDRADNVIEGGTPLTCEKPSGVAGGTTFNRE